MNESKFKTGDTVWVELVGGRGEVICKKHWEEVTITAYEKAGADGESVAEWWEITDKKGCRWTAFRDRLSTREEAVAKRLQGKI